MQAFPADGLLGAADNIFSYDAHQPKLTSQLAGVLRRHGIPAATGAEPFAVRLAPTTPLPPSEPIETWRAVPLPATAPPAGGPGATSPAEIVLQATETALDSSRGAWLAEREGAEG